MTAEPGTFLRRWRVIRNGKVILESEGNTFSSNVVSPGVDRCEAVLDVAGTSTIWILSNPIHVTGT